MGISVKIEVDDAGAVTVGEDKTDTDAQAAAAPEGGAPEVQEDAGMQQVGSVDEALVIAKQLLTQGPASAEQQQVATGYARAKGGQMGGQMGGM